MPCLNKKSKFMTINIKSKHLIIFCCVMAFGTYAYFYPEKIQRIFMSNAERTVDKALHILMKSPASNFTEVLDLDGEDKVFSSAYLVNIIGYSSYYKLDDWKLDSTTVEDDVYKVNVKGKFVNGFGARLNRSISFIVEKSSKERTNWNNESKEMKEIGLHLYGDKWVITDSYGFAVIDEINNEKSDMEKYYLLKDTKENVKISSWEFGSSYGGIINGKGIVENNSKIPVKFVKLTITYKNSNDEVVNSDETVIVNDNELFPGQKRNFEWYTANCDNCSKASIKLKFNN